MFLKTKHISIFLKPFFYYATFSNPSLSAHIRPHEEQKEQQEGMVAVAFTEAVVLDREERTPGKEHRMCMAVWSGQKVGVRGEERV